MAYLCTKFDSSSLSHFLDMDGGSKILNGSRDVNTPFQGYFVLGRLKSLRSPSTKILKARKNATIWVVWGVRGHPRSSETSLFDTAHMISYSTLIETMRLSFTVFEL